MQGYALCSAAAGLMVAILFPLRSPSPGLTKYALHQFGGAVFFFGATIGVQAVPDRLRRIGAPAWIGTVARVSGAAAIVALVAFSASVIASTSALESVRGLFQRACVVAINISLGALAIGLVSSRRAADDHVRPLASEDAVP
jgi:multisubunit Na+/H+ antiporter MnhG subunit